MVEGKTYSKYNPTAPRNTGPNKLLAPALFFLNINHAARRPR